MVLKAEFERMRTLISGVVSVLCKNGFSYTKEYFIEGLLAVTLDKDDIFLVNINELVIHDSSADSSDSECEVLRGDDSLSHSDSLRRNRKKRSHKTGDCFPGGESADNKHERVRTLIAGAVSIVCKNGLNYTKEFRIEGLLAVTLDKDNIFLVNINELVKHDSSTDFSDNEYEVLSGEDCLSYSHSLRRKCKKRYLKTGDCPPGGESGDNSNDEVDSRVHNGEGSAKENITCEENESDSDGDVVFLSIEDVPALVGEHNSNTNISKNSNSSQMNFRMLPGAQDNNSNIVSELPQQGQLFAIPTSDISGRNSSEFSSFTPSQSFNSPMFSQPLGSALVLSPANQTSQQVCTVR